MAILKFMLGNLKKRKSYSIVICMLVFLTGLILTVSVSTIQNTNKTYDNAFNHMKGPHLLFWYNQQSFKEEYQEWFKKQSSVESIKLRKAEFYNGADLKKGNEQLKESGDYYLFEYNPADNMRLKNSIYRPLTLLKKGDIYLPYVFKSDYDVKTGDKIDLVFGKNKLSFKIAGFIEEPLFGGAMIGGKFIFTSKADVQEFIKLGDKNLRHLLQMRVRFKSYNEASIYKITKDFMKKYGTSVNYLSQYKSQKIYHLTVPSIAMAVMITFAIILSIITITIMRYAILATIEADFLNIGIIKALGFTPFMVQLAITIQYGLIALFSGIISFVISIFVTPVVGQMMLRSSGLFFSGSLSIPIGMLIIFMLVLTISFFSYITARRTKRISPVRAISSGIAPNYYSSRINVKLENIGFLPFNLRMALKQVMTKSRKYILLITISALLAYSLAFSYSLVDFFNKDKSASLLGITVPDIELDAKTKEGAARLIEKIKKDYDIEWVYYERTEQLDLEDVRTVIKVENDFNATGELKTLDGRFPKHNNEIALSCLLRDKLKKDIGDYVSIKDKKGIKHSFIISGTFQTIDEGGLVSKINEAGMKVLDPSFESNEAYIKLKDNSNLEKIISEMKNKYTGYDEISNQKEETEDQINVIKTVFTAISKMVFIFTIIIISFITLLIMKITIYGEIRELGIFKALGFSSGRIRYQLALRFAIITILGGLIGVLIEIAIGARLFSMALHGVGISSVDLDFNILNAIKPILIISLLALFSAFISSGKTKKVSAYSLINE